MLLKMQAIDVCIYISPRGKDM